MLGGDFYKTISLTDQEGKIDSVIEFNTDHSIFAGHFPGHPVVPGVCMMQIMKELMETATGRQSRLFKASNMKFLTMIDPNRNPLIHAEIVYQQTEEEIRVSGKLFKDELTFMKCQIEFRFT